MPHLSIGQEAAIAGACLATRRSDHMTGTHRSHGHPIAKGAALGPLMAELLGKADGVCGGKGGSMHLADFAVGSLGESGIVASAIPVATGAGLSASILGTGAIALCFFGDGAANEGVFHESLNMASLWQLPVVYLCENNGYAVSVPVAEASAVPDVAARAGAYGMPGVAVDGQDVVAVHHAAVEAVARARAGAGPTLIEARTYRFHEHAYGLRLKQEYLDPQVVQGWRDGYDPIALFQARNLVPANEGARIREEVAADVQAAVAFARESPFPPPEAAYADVYA
jgi:pyruvate dehydrogenase E1 component alpha subunit